MKNTILKLEKKINEGKLINIEEAIELLKIQELNELLEAANRIRHRFCGNMADTCSIMNAKSGKCSEDCKYCAQSAHFHTNVKEYGLVDADSALSLAKENEGCGVNRFSLVTSGRGLAGEEFQRVLSIYEKLRDSTSMNLCASLGIMGFEQMKKLKNAGVSRYHHNLETSRGYYGKICTTHAYDERIDTIKAARKAGLEICSGGIIGMGETMEDRVSLAMELQRLEVKSIPVNVLNPIKGTPLENVDRLSQKEILRSMAVFRFMNPSAFIRMAGGRNLIEDFGKNCFKAGVNATITGNYLTTSGNNIEEDMKMIRELGLEVRKNG